MSIQSEGMAALFIVSGIIIVLSMLKSHRFFRALFTSAIQGTAALFAVNVVSALSGVSLAVNWLTLSVSAISGIPGVIMMVLASLILT